MLENFKKGSGGRYVWSDTEQKFIKTDGKARDPNAGLNGPIWFPKGGTKYFDKSLQRVFHSKSEKKNYMLEKGLKMDGSMDSSYDYNCPEAGLGKRAYSFGGQKYHTRTSKWR